MEPRLYKIVRPIITFLFKLIYHPHIIGKENIPEKGKIILAGNHTKFLDCLLLISCTKRTIHFLAKDELVRSPFGFIFKNMGIIPVDRKTHKDNALESAIKVLNDEKVIGIFPEGTINREKKEPTIPFKTGVVRMAYQTDSHIIPFTIKGKYSIFKNITIIFEKPYTVKSDNYKEETEKFRDKINTMITGGN